MTMQIDNYSNLYNHTGDPLDPVAQAAHLNGYIPWPTYPNWYPVQIPVAVPYVSYPAICPIGCICPAGSERTCEGPYCPRKDHSKKVAETKTEET